MIRYSLKCEKDHTFDSWFQSADAFEKLMNANMITCSVCGSSSVEKAVMAPGVRPARNDATKLPARPLSGPASPAEQALRELRKKIEKQSENVGQNFAKEARAIHDGDAPERSIYGEARIDEAKALVEDGIPVLPLPWRNKEKTN